MANLRFAAIRKISEIIAKSPDSTIDCWSVRKPDGTPAGKATEDCMIAIDVIDLDPRIDVGQFQIEHNPYGEKGSNLSRLKFNIFE